MLGRIFALSLFLLLSVQAFGQSGRQPVRYRNWGGIWDRQTEPNRFWPERWTSGRSKSKVPALKTSKQLRKRKASNGVPLFRAAGRRASEKNRAKGKKKP